MSALRLSKLDCSEDYKSKQLNKTTSLLSKSHLPLSLLYLPNNYATTKGFQYFLVFIVDFMDRTCMFHC